jgi:hypothetical protein
MIKRILSIVIFAAVISSCGNTGKKEASSKVAGPGDAVKVEFASLVANPDNYVGKNIIVEGKVVHVCMETGKKLFIVGENPDIRLFISAGENIPKFPTTLLGSQVVVEGVITRVGGQIAASEPQATGDAAKSAEKGTKTATGKACETETALAGQPTLANIVMEYKSHTVLQ